jgi:hypothetical protein
MSAKQAVVAAAAVATRNRADSARPSGPAPASDGLERARNFSQAPGLRGLPDGNQARNGRLQGSGAFAIVSSERDALCLHASQQPCLRVPSPAGQVTLLDDGVL